MPAADREQITERNLALNPTAEQWQQLRKLSREWIGQARRIDAPERQQTENAIAELYDWLRLEKPLIVWCDSPWQMMVMPAVLHCILRSPPLRFELTQLSQNASGLWLSLWQKLMQQCEPAWNQLSEWPQTELFEPIRDPEITSIRRSSKDFFRAASASEFFVDLSPHLTLRHDDFMLQLSSGCSLNLSKKSFASIKSNCIDPCTREGGALSRRQILAELNNTLDWSRLVGEWRSQLTAQARKQTTSSSQRGFVGSYLGSPWQEAEHVLRIALRNTWWGAWTSNWLPVYEFLFGNFELPAADLETKRELNCWLNLARQTTAYLFLKRICFVCTRPNSLNLDDLGRLHHEEKSAVIFPDGYQLFSWHGTTVTERLITHPGEITIKSIESTRNIELRRVMIERFGSGKYLTESGARKVQEDEFGILYSKTMNQDEAIVMVKVTNKTAEPDGTFKDYFLRVPPTISKARDAVAWTFGIQPADYHPDLET